MVADPLRSRGASALVDVKGTDSHPPARRSDTVPQFCLHYQSSGSGPAEGSSAEMAQRVSTSCFARSKDWRTHSADGRNAVLELAVVPERTVFHLKPGFERWMSQVTSTVRSKDAPFSFAGAERAEALASVTSFANPLGGVVVFLESDFLEPRLDALVALKVGVGRRAVDDRDVLRLGVVALELGRQVPIERVGTRGGIGLDEGRDRKAARSRSAWRAYEVGKGKVARTRLCVDRKAASFTVALPEIVSGRGGRVRVRERHLLGTVQGRRRTAGEVVLVGVRERRRGRHREQMVILSLLVFLVDGAEGAGRKRWARARRDWPRGRRRRVVDVSGRACGWRDRWTRVQRVLRHRNMLLNIIAEAPLARVERERLSEGRVRSGVVRQGPGTGVEVRLRERVAIFDAGDSLDGEMVGDGGGGRRPRWDARLGGAAGRVTSGRGGVGRVE